MEMPELRRAMTMMQKVCPREKVNREVWWILTGCFSMPLFAGWRDGVVFSRIMYISANNFPKVRGWAPTSEIFAHSLFLTSILYTIEKYRKTAVQDLIYVFIGSAKWRNPDNSRKKKSQFSDHLFCFFFNSLFFLWRSNNQHLVLWGGTNFKKGTPPKSLLYSLATLRGMGKWTSAALPSVLSAMCKIGK